jgi:hypothetical protein
LDYDFQIVTLQLGYRSNPSRVRTIKMSDIDTIWKESDPMLEDCKAASKRFLRTLIDQFVESKFTELWLSPATHAVLRKLAHQIAEKCEFGHESKDTP